MAISAVHRAKAEFSTDATQYSLGPAWTPDANTLLVMCVVTGFGSGAPNQVSVVGGFGPWQEVATYQPDTAGTQYRMSVLACKVTTPTLDNPTIGFDGQTQTGCSAVLDEWAGVDLSGDALNAFRQTKTGSVNSSGLSETITLDSAILAGNATGGVFYHQVNEPGTTPDTGYTLLGEAAHSGPSDTTATIWRADGQTSVGASWVTSGSRGGIAWEMKAAAEPAGVSVLLLGGL